MYRGDGIADRPPHRQMVVQCSERAISLQAKRVCQVDLIRNAPEDARFILVKREEPVETIGRNQAIALVERYPERFQVSARRKKRLAIVEQDPSAWHCYRVDEAAVYPPWPGNV